MCTVSSAGYCKGDEAEVKVPTLEDAVPIRFDSERPSGGGKLATKVSNGLRLGFQALNFGARHWQGRVFTVYVNHVTHTLKKLTSIPSSFALVLHLF